jgi:hypothetical protein
MLTWQVKPVILGVALGLPPCRFDRLGGRRICRDGRDAERRQTRGDLRQEESPRMGR